MCFQMKLTPTQFYTQFGYDAKKLQFEQEFNIKNLEKLNHSLQEDSR